VEASAVHAPVGLARLPLGTPLLRLRSDEQLLALFRAGSEEAFGVIHDRYRQRLFAYIRQMMCAAPRQDAEDVLQDVFVRAYGALRADRRHVHVRAWLYRVAHNRCIDHMRRPVPPAADVFEMSRKPLHDPLEEAQRREDLTQLVQDVGRLPEHQRSALLMREIDGMSYADLAGALDVTVPAVKSLLVRARIGLVEAAEARDADCAEIRHDLTESYDRGVKASGRARRHMRTCEGCREYRGALRGIRRSFAALNPLGAGPLAMAGAKLLGFGSAGGAAAGGSAVTGGGAAVTGGVATVSACKVAAVACTAALTAGGAVEVRHLTSPHRDAAPERAAPRVAAPPAPAPARELSHPLTGYRPSTEPVADRSATRRERVKPRPEKKPVVAPAPTETPTNEAAPVVEPNVSGGTQAPPAAGEEPVAEAPPAPVTPTEPAVQAPPAAVPTTPPPADPGTGTPPTEH
jgi:RNA polymerase sigma factor (sigma-70 family)